MTHINQRRDLASVWASTNPVLQEGEVGWERDTRKSKLGDGVTAWNDLAYTVAGNIATKADVGLGSVDNTSDMDKPVSTAQQAEFDTKAPIASPTFTGNPKAPTPATTDSDTSIATTAFVQAVAALSRAKRWVSTGTYTVGDVVGYGGGVYRCMAAPTAALPPALNTANWEVVVPPDTDGWALPDPYFSSTSLLNTWQTYWKSGTINSVAFTTTAGEFESGQRALKVDLAANSAQRLYGFSENLVKGGEIIQVKARVKYLSGTSGQVTASATLLQNDATGNPEPLASGVTSTSSMENAVALTTVWQTVTFTFVAANAKPRAVVDLFINSGNAAAVVVVDWVKISRKPDLRGMLSGQRAPEVWHPVGASGEPAFENGWVNLDARAAMFRRDGNIVRLKGIIKNGVVGSPIFHLPAGYRPSNTLFADLNFPVVSNNLFGYIGIGGSDGQVTLQSGSNVYVDLAPISFVAEN